MGTSSLYGGPKKTSLLPSDYNPEEGLLDGVPIGNPSELPNNESPEGEMPEADNPNETGPAQSMNPAPIDSWKDVRTSVTRAMNHPTDRNVKGAISKYTKAIGGHSNATRQAKKARMTSGVLLNYFTGTPEVVRTRFEQAGIRFDGRPTKEILNDMCLLLSPTSNDLEESLTNKALLETITDVALDVSVDLNDMESFNEQLLKRLVGGFVKHYIFDKLMQQSIQGALNRCDNISKLKDLEKNIKRYIDGLVDGVISDIVYPGLDSMDFNRAVETLFDVTYQQMEELQ